MYDHYGRRTDHRKAASDHFSPSVRTYVVAPTLREIFPSAVAGAELGLVFFTAVDQTLLYQPQYPPYIRRYSVV